MKHLLGLENLSSEEVGEILDLGMRVKANPAMWSAALRGKTLAMLFEKTSTRTRVSFESGMTQLGGHAQFLDWRTTNFTLGDVKDEIRCIDRYVDAVMARVYRHGTLEEMAAYSRIPIINGLCDREHPCQILADLLTLQEKYGRLKGLRVAYVGDGNNICNSLIIGCAKVGAEIRVATPKKYKPAPFAQKIGTALKKYSWFSDPKSAVRGAHAVYTDTWVSMGDEAQKETRLKAFPPYQVNKKLMKLAAADASFMHCLPAHRGYEVSDEVLDGKQSIVYDQAENRLHAQKAVLLTLLFRRK